MDKHPLLLKLGIHDFVCRGVARKSCVYIEEYIRQSTLIENNFAEKFKKDIQKQGFSPEMLKLLFEGDEQLTTGLLNNIGELASSVSVGELVEDQKSLYLSNQEKITKMESTLQDTLIEPTLKINLENALTNLKKSQQDILQTALQSKMLENPESLTSNPAFIKKMLYILSEDTQFKPSFKDEDNVLYELENKIIHYFLMSKGFDEKAIEQITLGSHDMAFSNNDFSELCKQIIEEKENGFQPESLDFFMSTMSGRN